MAWKLSDWKKWGELGGRPQKWGSEAERKKISRLLKAQKEGRELRSYRGFSEIKETESKKFRWKRNCPHCKKGELSYGKVDGKNLQFCNLCNWKETPGNIYFSRAGTVAERVAAFRERKKKEWELAKLKERGEEEEEDDEDE
ncbi:MAG: hypothetical protein I3273_06900 [Candidatus Moeniiplasma glomeromycotorum]|nr:hypothetical protein [Candidatus Moeniiplasma glomeromycotorum]MCE8168278.1 hypothetical protein [Candidatus Moeniiplasma glomeromycotorum]MCE8169814.1 hypothetical protein [Candidatus Moeniiplasma glomeromycotorum]